MAEIIDANKTANWLRAEKSFPDKAKIFVTESGSIDKKVFVKPVPYINRHARKQYIRMSIFCYS